MTMVNVKTDQITKGEVHLILTTFEQTKITFTKKDGSVREIKCTLKNIPVYEKKTDRVKTPNDNILPVWDLDKKEWRSITIANITSIETLI